MSKAEMIMRGSTALESANALFRRAQAPANAKRLIFYIWDGVTHAPHGGGFIEGGGCSL